MGAQEFGDELLRGLLERETRSLSGLLGAGVLVSEQVEASERRRGGSGRSRPPRVAAPTLTTTVRVVAAIGTAEVLDPAQAEGRLGPAWEAAEGEPVVLAIGPEEAQRWAPLGAAGPLALGVQGVVVLPDQPGEAGARTVVTGYFDRAPDPGDVDTLHDAAPILNRALAMVEYATAEELKAEQMLQMIQYRRVIEQAKGLVLAAVGGDAPSAFTTLSRASQHFNVRLRNLAVALVEYVGDGSAEHPDDPELVIHPSEADRQAAIQVWAALTARPTAAEPQPEGAGHQG